MKYQEAVFGITRAYARPDGYSGNIAICGLAYDPETRHAIEVHEHGCHRANTTAYHDEDEMVYYYDHHRAVHFPRATPLATIGAIPWLSRRRNEGDRPHVND